MKRLCDALSAVVHWCCKWPAGEFLAGLVVCGLIGVLAGALYAFPLFSGLVGLWCFYDGVLRTPRKPKD